MIRQMKALLRIKELKQEQALNTMHARHAQLEQAREATRRAFETAEAFRVTIPAREDAVYARVLGRVVGIGSLDDVRADIVAIEHEYTALRDDWDRARQIEARRKEELDEAIAAYRTAVKNRDKYIDITGTMQVEAEEMAALKEEIELEDLFTRPARRIA
ncbi:YscO family type III secretion system apparatus protein [Pseudochelatococcus lubricantis]|uniref:type III secretion system stalk subunit SctO n=1 Tax=Pseudochelatococcus lubricantis TaxID=1538102 RepID=UPI0035F046F1